MNYGKEVWLLNDHPIIRPRNLKEREKLRSTIRPSWSNCASASELMKVIEMDVNKEPYERQPYEAPFHTRNEAYIEDARAGIIHADAIDMEEKHWQKTRKVLTAAEARKLPKLRRGEKYSDISNITSEED
jgi:hypothetical protein